MSIVKHCTLPCSDYGHGVGRLPGAPSLRVLCERVGGFARCHLPRAGSLSEYPPFPKPGKGEASRRFIFSTPAPSPKSMMRVKVIFKKIEGDLLGHPEIVLTSDALIEALVAEQNSRRDAHVVVVARTIGVEREPVQLKRTYCETAACFYVHAASEHHCKSVI